MRHTRQRVEQALGPFQALVPPWLQKQPGVTSGLAYPFFEAVILILLENDFIDLSRATVLQLLQN